VYFAKPSQGEGGWGEGPQQAACDLCAVRHVCCGQTRFEEACK